MKIRSITYFCNPQWPINEKTLQRAGDFILQAKNAYEAAGYDVQTTRLATIPFPYIVEDCDAAEIIQFARRLEEAVRSQAYDYVAIGPALPDMPGSYQVIPEILATTEIVFLSGFTAWPPRGVDLRDVRACADVIHQTATITADGFANLRFAALANVPPGAPFFPAAYHAHSRSGDHVPVCFALATEAADLAVEAFSNAVDIQSAQQALVALLEEHAHNLENVAASLATRNGVAFGGLDFTLAPYPKHRRSIGTAIEHMGVPAVGLHGSLAATAILTNAIDQANFKRTGFSGVMLPLLEDAALAASAEKGILNLTDLLLYSAVCGTGLDTLPLPGDVSPDQITAILLDLTAMALRLDKPLTARLMPIPGKVAGDLTSFDFEYFANSRVLDVKAEPLQRLFAGEGFVELNKR